MDILLIDVYSKTKSDLIETGGFNAYFHKLLDIYYGIGYKLPPSPYEFKLIITDFMNTDSNQNRERIDHLEYQEQVQERPQAKGVFRMNPDTDAMSIIAREHLTPNLREALDFGIPIVVIAGELRDSSKDNNNYSWLMELLSGLVISGIRPRSGPASIECSSSDRSIEELYEKFQKDLTWEASFSSTSNDPTQSSPHILFKNAKGEPTGFTLNIGKSEIIVLPNIKDVMIRSHYITYILNEFFPQFRPNWFPSRWPVTYIPNALLEKSNEIQAKKEEVLKRYIQEENRIETIKRQLTSYIDLLTQADDRLVEAVKCSLQEIFNVSISDMDTIRDKEGRKRLFDLIINMDGKHFAIEIKGGKRSLKKEMLNQTMDNVSEYLTENPYTHFDGIVLIINDQIHKAPNERQPYSPDLIKKAEEQEITILSATILLELMAAYLTEDLSKSEIVRILSGPGLAEIQKK